MQVLYWTQQYWPSIGGVEVVATRFIAAMRRRGFAFTVVTAHGEHPLPDVEEHEGVVIHRFPFLQALAERDMDRLVELTRAVVALKERLRPQLVHIHLSDPSALFHLRSERARRVPSVVTVRVAPPQLLPPASLLRTLLETAAWITADSAAVAADVAALVPAVTARTSVMYPTLELPALPPSPVPFDPPMLLCIGRVVEEKGFDLAIDALPAVLAAYPGTRLVIAGDGAARHDLERRAERLGLQQPVSFCGWVAPEAVPTLLNQATLVLVPSRWREAFGTVTLQAAQMERPVVCTNAGGLPEAVEHEHSGLVVPVDDRAAFTAAVLRLLSDRELCRRLGAQGRARAHARFSWTRHLEAYEAIYRRAARAGDPASA